MRIGSKLAAGYVLLLGLMGTLVFLGIDGEQRLSENYDTLARLSRLESSITMIHKTALAGAGHDVLLELSDELAKELKEVNSTKGSNEAAIIRRAELANMAYKEKLGALKSLYSGINRYTELAKENVNNIAEDVERIAAILADQRVPLLSASSLDAQRKRDERLAAMQKSVQNLQVTLRLMETSTKKSDYDTAKNDAGLLLESCIALRTSLQATDLLVLDRATVAVKNLNADFIQLGQLYNRIFEVNSSTKSGLSDVKVAVKQLADAQRDTLSFIRESSILPAVAIIASAVIVALIFYLIILRASGGFIARVEQAVHGLTTGEMPPSSGKAFGNSHLESALLAAWSKVAEQAKALEQIAEGKSVVDLENKLGLDAVSRAINDVENTRREMEQTLRDCLESVNQPATGSASEMLQTLKTCVYDSYTSLATVTEKIQHLGRSGTALEKGLSKAASHSEQAFSTLHKGKSFSEMASAVSAAVDGAAAPANDSSNTVAELKGQFNEIERAIKVMGWQVGSYEDVARNLETLAINVNVEAARVGADTTAMGTIVEEIRALCAKCRHAAEASDNGKTLSSRALDRVFGALDLLESKKPSSVSAVDGDALKRAAQVLGQLESVELALTAIFTKATVSCSEFVNEAEALVSVVENASETSAKLSEELAETAAEDVAKAVAEDSPIVLTEQVTTFDDGVTELPKLDL
ncbi:hypothetical protein [Halodesulfovibrio sp.]|jgi:hypothetical protein|uniref:hypothetical protein n=1 Tax=Halodesulfovibrio sp. TaxID=1912772 RepID=UPI0025DF948A|nr:hypothetical protein [Halodesulfovibrio sp.]MCT4627262.1 hypothetical protein [Halodesulfovibrio sp.]